MNVLQNYHLTVIEYLYRGCRTVHMQTFTTRHNQWRMQDLTKGGRQQGVLGTSSPSGVQGRSPGRGSGGRSPPEAEAFLQMDRVNFDASKTKFVKGNNDHLHAKLQTQKPVHQLSSIPNYCQNWLQYQHCKMEQTADRQAMSVFSSILGKNAQK